MRKSLLTFLLTAISFFGFSQSDLCETATVIDPNSGCITGSNAVATSSLTTNGCTPDPVNEVWFTYVVEGTQDSFTLNSLGLEDAVLTLYADGCGTGTYDFCTSVTGTTQLLATYGFQPGDQVWISVASNTLTDGDFELCVTSTTTTSGTTGENSCNPISICTEQSNLSISTYGSTSGTKASCFTGPGSNATEDVWISFCVAQSGDITWTGNPASNSTEFDWSMWDITDGCPGTEVACNYDWNQQTGVNFGMAIGDSETDGDDYDPAFYGIAGRCYAIQVVNWSIDGTGFTFSGIDDDCGTCAKISPAVDFSISQTDQCSPPVTVTFNTGAGHVGTVDWDFGNGNTSTQSGTPSSQVYTDPGTYAITASAGTGTCFDQETEYVTVYAPLQAGYNIVDDFCNDTNEGAISIFPAGGDGVYTYTWSPNVSSGPSATGLPAGDYEITVSNATCAESVVLNVTLTGVVCCGVDIAFANNRLCMSDAPITLTPTITGTSSYTISWSPGDYLSDPTSETPTFTPPSAGTYSYTLTVDNSITEGGCATPRDVTFTVVDVIPAGQATATSCPGTCDGEVQITGISGGVEPYVIAWDNGPTGTSQSSLCAGTYTATVTEDGGCQGVLPLEVIESIPFTLDAGFHDCNTTPLNSGECFTLPGVASITPTYTCNNTDHEWNGTTTITNCSGVGGSCTPTPTNQGVNVSGTASGDILQSICFEISHSKHSDIVNIYITSPSGEVISFFADPTYALSGSNGTVYCFDPSLLDGYSGDLNGTWTLTLSDNRSSGGGTGSITNITITTCNPVFPDLWSPTTNMTGDPSSLSTEVCPTATTTYTLTITDANGCTQTDDIEVIVGPCTLLNSDKISLNANYNSDKVIIKWHTTDDYLTERYLIEKSVNSKDFISLDRVNSLGSSGNYLAIDNNPTSGTMYYKIIALDENGVENYSAITSVIITKKNQKMSIVPNPAKESVQLIINKEHNGASDIQIFDVLGKEVYFNSRELNKGENHINIDISKLSSGVYEVIHRQGEEIETSKLIVK